MRLHVMLLLALGVLLPARVLAQGCCQRDHPTFSDTCFGSLDPVDTTCVGDTEADCVMEYSGVCFSETFPYGYPAPQKFWLPEKTCVDGYCVDAAEAECASWCNVHTCSHSECEGCETCEALGSGSVCEGWCNIFTCSMNHCAGCSMCEPTSTRCHGWCNGYTCGMMGSCGEMKAPSDPSSPFS